MTEKSNVLVFPENGGNNNGSIDPALLFATMNNGGWGGMNNPFWMIFMLPFLYPFFNMFGGYGNWGNGNFGGGTGFLANQLNNDAGRDLIMQGIQGNREAISSLANMLNTDISTIQSGLNTVGSKIQEVGSQVGMSGLQVINAIQSGNSSLAAQLANCCCENRLATCQQTNTITSQMAAHDANVRLQLAQNEAADQLSVCQQTNTLTRQADGNTNTIVKAIADQNAMIVKEFCDLKERELQDKINTQGDIITQLRNQISNDKQTLQFNSAFQALDNKIDAIAAKQPNTVPVTWPNLTAVNNTPYAGGYPYYGNGFGGGIVF
jgi:hypothetical protein